MADKNFRVKNGLEAPLIAGSDGTTAITLVGAGDANISGNLILNGNTIKSSAGTTALTVSDNDVTVADRLFVAGNIIGSNGGYSTITMSTNDVAIAGNIQVNGGTINGPSGATDLVIQNASTIQLKNDFTLFSTDAGVTKSYFDNANGKFTFNGTNTDNTNNYNLYSHGTLGTLGNATIGGDLTVTGANINTGATDVITQIDRTSSGTSGFARSVLLQSTSTGTPAVGFGPAIGFKGQTATSTFKDAAYIAVQASNVTAGSESFNMNFGLMQSNNTYANRLSLFSNGDIDMYAGGKLAIKGATNGYSQFGAPATGNNITYTLPGADGTSGQVLSTNGSGTLSWATASGGSGTSLPAVKSESLSSQPWSTMPGCLYIGSIGNSITTAAQSLRYHPFYVAAPITLTEVALSVSTATSLASCNAMIYIVDVNLSSTGWQPTSNRSGGYCGEITSITTTGIKSITGLSISLPAGAYLIAVQFSNFTGTLQCRSMANQVITGNGYALATSDGTTYAMNRTGVTYVSGTPAAAANWTNGAYGSAGHPGIVLAKWTVN